MPIYTHSKISVFEQCPFKFKLRYIDKIIPEIEQSIEAYLGEIVHDTLEWLYIQVKDKKIPTINQLIEYYSEKWQENYKPKMVIVKKELNAKDYFNKGVGFVLSYYLKHKPFEDNTIALEEKIFLDLDENGEYKIIGFIDRLTYDKERDVYEIHDYKTANNLPLQEKIDNDKQLALYSLAIKEKFGRDKKVCLVWHYLAHDTKICSERTNQQLQQLRQDTLSIIKHIESQKEFPTKKTTLCNWCEYKDICPAFTGRPFKKEEQKKLIL